MRGFVTATLGLPVKNAERSVAAAERGHPSTALRQSYSRWSHSLLRSRLPLLRWEYGQTDEQNCAGRNASRDERSAGDRRDPRAADVARGARPPARAVATDGLGDRRRPGRPRPD